MAGEAGQLIVQIEGNAVQTLALTMPVLSIGRTPDNGLSLPHPLVSRRHAELRLGPEGAILTDLGSANGTFVDGNRLLPDQPVPLADGTIFQIGPFVLAYRAPRVEPVRETAADGQPTTAPEPSATTEEEAVAAPEPSATTEGAAASAPEAPTPSDAILPTTSPSASDDDGAPAPETLPVPATVPTETVQSRPLAPPRERWPVPRAHGPVSRYLNNLPVVFQDNDFLGRFLLIFETIWEPLEQRHDHIAMYFNPYTASESHLPWLASWLDIAFNSHWPEARRRALVAEAMDLYRWRGTRYGLTRMIEVCTGLIPEITEDQTRPDVFRIRVTIPANSDADRDMIDDLVRAHKPAHVGYILETTP